MPAFQQDKQVIILICLDQWIHAIIQLTHVFLKFGKGITSDPQDPIIQLLDLGNFFHHPLVTILAGINILLKLH